MAPVIGYGISQDRDHAPEDHEPARLLDRVAEAAARQSVSRFRIEQKQVLIATSAACVVTLNAPGTEVEMHLDAWDTASIPAGAWRSFRNASRHRCRDLRDHGG